MSDVTSDATKKELIFHLTDDSFQKEIGSGWTVVDFWAEWCGPCRAIANTMKELAVEWEGKVKVAKLNVDENQNVPMNYGIQGIPTLILFKDGQIVDRIVGAMTKDMYRGRIMEHVNKAQD